MKDDIGYAIVLMSRVMGLPTTRHLQTWMIHFIEAINTKKMEINWATILSDNLDEKLATVKVNPPFYMTSYMAYLLVARAIDYPDL